MNASCCNTLKTKLLTFMNKLYKNIYTITSIITLYNQAYFLINDARWKQYVISYTGKISTLLYIITYLYCPLHNIGIVFLCITIKQSWHPLCSASPMQSLAMQHHFSPHLTQAMTRPSFECGPGHTTDIRACELPWYISEHIYLHNLKSTKPVHWEISNTS